MSKRAHKYELLARRKKRVRKKMVRRMQVTHDAETKRRPRISVYRSLKHIYAQIIDDVEGKTLASASSIMLKIPGGRIEGAKIVGKALAERALEQGIRKVRFDRNGRLYHGRIKALAEAAREGGLEF